MSTNSTRTAPEHVAKAVMKYEGLESTPGSSNPKLVYVCTKLGYGKKVKFATKSGFSNPYQHLRSCYGRGLSIADQEKVLQELYEAARKDQRMHGGTILSHFNVSALSEYVRAIYSYMRLIVLRILALSLVEKVNLRSISRFNIRIARDTLSEVMFSLCELV